VKPLWRDAVNNSSFIEFSPQFTIYTHDMILVVCLKVYKQAALQTSKLSAQGIVGYNYAKTSRVHVTNMSFKRSCAFHFINQTMSLFVIIFLLFISAGK